MKRRAIYIVTLLLIVVYGCGREQGVDPLRRSRVDGFNKDAFVNRYRDPQRCLNYSQQALNYIHDSLPDYVDGELRALNNMAFAYFLMSNYPEANQMLDRVERQVERGKRKEGRGKIANGEIESVISDYNSNNTERLDVAGMKALLLKLPMIHEEFGV